MEEKNGYVFRGNSIYRQLFYCYPYYFIYKDKYVPIENKFFSRFKFAFKTRFISVQNVVQWKLVFVFEIMPYNINERKFIACNGLYA